MHFFPSKNGLFTPCLLAQALVVVSFFYFTMCIEGRKKMSFRKKVVCSVVFFLFFVFSFNVHTQLLLLLLVESFPSSRSPNVYFCCCFPFFFIGRSVVAGSASRIFFFFSRKSSPDSLCILKNLNYRCFIFCSLLCFTSARMCHIAG